MPPDQFTRYCDYLVYLNQASIVVPMAVVWLRRKRFSPLVKLLSAYVYLSAGCSVGISFLYPAVFATNYWFITGFNLGKILLFGAVYYGALDSALARRTVLGSTLAAAAFIAVVFGYDTRTGITCARLCQCAVLAGFGLLYLEQTLNRPPTPRASHNPLWLLSIGQLLYSAGTVTAFSFDYLALTVYDQNYQALVFTTLGLVFNGFLTLAFLRSRLRDAAAPAPQPAAVAQLAVG